MPSFPGCAITGVAHAIYIITGVAHAVYIITGVAHAIYIVSGIVYVVYLNSGVAHAGIADVCGVLQEVHVPPENDEAHL